MKNFIRIPICLWSLKLGSYLAFLCGCFDLVAFDSKTTLDFSTGYRNDSLQRKNTLELDPPYVDQIDKIQINNISLWQVGLNADCRVSPVSQGNFKEGSHLHNIFLSGFAYFGTNIWNPTLHETIEGHGEQQTGKAEVNDVDTADYQIGLGYLADWDDWSLGVLGGYAYDSQIINTKKGQISFPEGAPFEDAFLYGKGYSTATAWKGPWAGIQLAYAWSHGKVDLGYEYHFARYTANHSIPIGAIAQIEGYKTYTKSSARGNVVFLKGVYLFCKRWEVGACFKYQHWLANHGQLTSPFFFANGYPSETKVRALGKWISYGIDFNVGCSF